jgi:subtilisin family serine protease
MEPVQVILRLAPALRDAGLGRPQALDAVDNLFADVPEGTALRHRRRHGANAPRLTFYPRLGLAVGYVWPDNLSVLENNDHFASMMRVEAEGPSLVRPIARTPTQSPPRPNWGVRRVGADVLWAQGITGDGILIGHLDTGLEAKHQALRHRVAAFAEFDLAGTRKRDAEPNDSDPFGHGTHTAGIMVGDVASKGRFGVAPDAKLVSALVIEGGDVLSRVLGGLDWMLGQGIRVLNMSLGLPGYRAAFTGAVEALEEAGVLCVAAIGNDGPGTSRSPGDYRSVLSVGAIDQADAVVDFSASATTAHDPPPYGVPMLVAPGVRIQSCVRNGGYAEDSGTSMAAPHVAGLAALLWQGAPTATATDIAEAILASCTLAPGMTPDRAGRGVPDARLALATLRSRGLVDARFPTGPVG